MMILAVIAIIVLIILGVGVAFAFGIGSFVAMEGVGDPTLVPTVAYSTINSFPLLAIPFFLLAGTIMKDGGVSSRLVDFVSIFTGWFKGGMGVALTGASAIFGAISGSSVATVSAMGSIMTPEMVKRGYPRRYIAGLVSVSGILGILIPPSIPMIVYGIAANVSIGHMFMAGVVPGLLLFATLSLVNVTWARRQPEINDRHVVLEGGEGAVTDAGVSADVRANEVVAESASGGTTTKLATRPATTPKVQHSPLRRGIGAIPALLMPVVILGGIYGGIFTPTESGAAACLYGLIVGLFVYRGLKPGKIANTFLNGMLSSAPILLIIAMGGAFSRAITMSGLPADLTVWVSELGLSTWMLLLVLNIMLLLVGMLVEENTAIIVLAPLLMPIVTMAGIDPVQFGVIMVLNLGIGLATPPMAPNIFVAAGACEVPSHLIVGTTMRFLALGALPVLIAVNVVPALTLWSTR